MPGGGGEERGEFRLGRRSDGEVRAARLRVEDPLVRSSLEVGVERAQRLVPDHDVGERRLERLPVERAVEP